MLTCSFTGHRNINTKHLCCLSDMLCRAIEYAYAKGCRRFMTGGAVGFDTEAASAVIKFRITHPDVSLVLVLPCENQSQRWSVQQKMNYEYTLAAADEVIYVAEQYTLGCMRKRNKMLAEVADILIAYVCRSNSGAAQTVRMAMELSKEIYNLYPALDKSV